MAWYIVKQPTGHCEIAQREIVPIDSPQDLPQTVPPSDAQTWGPFESQGEAIARRVGLIRAGKCQPS
ncbi:MAG: DDE transposase family protein [Leptolyngbyaceae cyanobacterium CSU_1_4]|nr:DDE transposase family protein [Leptolyngbyaceae cyanobacterium CSU_1_4]